MKQHLTFDSKKFLCLTLKPCNSLPVSHCNFSSAYRYSHLLFFYCCHSLVLFVSSYCWCSNFVHFLLMLLLLLMVFSFILLLLLFDVIIILLHIFSCCRVYIIRKTCSWKKRLVSAWSLDCWACLTNDTCVFRILFEQYECCCVPHLSFLLYCWNELDMKQIKN